MPTLVYTAPMLYRVVLLYCSHTTVFYCFHTIKYIKYSTVPNQYKLVTEVVLYDCSVCMRYIV